MNKKPKRVNREAQKVKHSSEYQRLLRYFVAGDFRDARTFAHEIGASSSSTDVDKALAINVLKMTWPDPLALAVGCACLIFSSVVAFLVGG